MSLDHLWAGWRAAYVSSVSGEHPGSPGTPGTDCVFCRIIESKEPDEARLVVHTSTRCVVMLNAFPYAPGHLLILPRRHVNELEGLDGEESAELWAVTGEAVAAMKAAYGPEGLNLGANLGRAAGAGIPDHLHLHVVPRWIGDTNFMTGIASTRVLPEALPDSWRKLVQAWPA